jgi:hypothetical protein
MTREEILDDCLARNWRVNTFISGVEITCTIATMTGLQIGHYTGDRGADWRISERNILWHTYKRAIKNAETLNSARDERLTNQPELWELWGEQGGTSTR